jgi:hypothetical protein
VKRAVVAGFVLALTMSGVAVAYWSSAGSGSGSAAAGTITSLSLTPGTPSNRLYPGSSADVSLTITNPNAVVVRVPRLTLDTSQGTNGFSADASHSGCGLAALAFTTQTNAGSGWNVPASGSLAVTLSGALAMAASASNACQGATFTIFLTPGTGV